MRSPGAGFFDVVGLLADARRADALPPQPGWCFVQAEKRVWPHRRCRRVADPKSPACFPDKRGGSGGRVIKQAESLLARSGILQGVEPSAAAALIQRLQLVEFRSRERIYSQGEPGDRLYIVVTGKVKIGRRSPDGREQLLSVMGPADMFGALSMFDPGPRTANATAITDVCAACMDHDALREWITGRPQIAEQLLRVLARRLRRTDDHIGDLIFTDVPGRVAKQLLQLAQRFSTQQGEDLRLIHDLTQEEIAQLVGASRETVNKALSNFAQRGWITVDGKTILIHDVERLARRAR